MLEIIVCVVSLTSDSLTEDSEVKIPALTEVWILQSRVIFGKLTLGIEIFCCGILGILILGNITFGIVGKDFVEILWKTVLVACIAAEDVSFCCASSCSSMIQCLLYKVLTILSLS